MSRFCVTLGCRMIGERRIIEETPGDAMGITLTRFRAVVVGVLALLIAGCSITGLFGQSREKVLQRILPSAVQIVIEQQEGRRVRTGSGVALAARRSGDRPGCFVLTSGHTLSGISGKKEVYVIFSRERGADDKRRASVVTYRDTADTDLALLRTDEGPCVPARIAAAPSLGESVWVIGFPWGRHMTLASGIVSQINRAGADRESAARLMVDAPVSYGSSGGGVFETRHGRLIGIVEGYNTARVSSRGANPAWYIDVPVPGQTFVTPLSDVKQFLARAGYAELMESETVATRFSKLR
jgi:S1-C subfamily serine protease